VPAEFVGSSLHACTQVSAWGLMKEILEMEWKAQVAMAAEKVRGGKQTT